MQQGQQQGQQQMQQQYNPNGQYQPKRQLPHQQAIQYEQQLMHGQYNHQQGQQQQQMQHQQQEHQQQQQQQQGQMPVHHEGKQDSPGSVNDGRGLDTKEQTWLPATLEDHMLGTSHQQMTSPVPQGYYVGGGGSIDDATSIQSQRSQMTAGSMASPQLHNQPQVALAPQY